MIDRVPLLAFAVAVMSSESVHADFPVQIDDADVDVGDNCGVDFPGDRGVALSCMRDAFAKCEPRYAFDLRASIDGRFERRGLFIRRVHDGCELLMTIDNLDDRGAAQRQIAVQHCTLIGTGPRIEFLPHPELRTPAPELMLLGGEMRFGCGPSKTIETCPPARLDVPGSGCNEETWNKDGCGCIAPIVKTHAGAIDISDLLSPARRPTPSREAGPCPCQTTSVGVVCSNDRYEYQFVGESLVNTRLDDALPALFTLFPDVEVQLQVAEDEDALVVADVLVSRLEALGARHITRVNRDGKQVAGVDIAGTGVSISYRPTTGVVWVTLHGDVSVREGISSDSSARLLKTVNKPVQCTNPHGRKGKAD